MWVDEDVVQALGRLTSVFVLHFVELLRSRPDDDSARITVQTAIAHLHVAHMLGSGVLPDDGRSVRNNLRALLDGLQVPPAQTDTLQVRSKLVHAIGKMLAGVVAADGLELDPATMLTAWGKARRGHRAAKL